MSFVHFTLVGHFDPRKVARDKTCSRPLDPDRVARLLAEYPAEVVKQVTLRDGYADCLHGGLEPIQQHLLEFAYRLAREEGCLAVEQGREVMYPPEAARRQLEGIQSDPEQLDRWEARARRFVAWVLRGAGS